MIIQQLSDQIFVLKELLISLTDQQYTQKISYLNASSIGAHTRHIIELIQCVAKGHTTGMVDYINRERNFEIEQNRNVAIAEIEGLVMHLPSTDKLLGLLTETQDNEVAGILSTTYFREIEYNREHAIHHLALIRVALHEMNLSLVNESFGVAHATLKYLSVQKQLQS